MKVEEKARQVEELKDKFSQVKGLWFTDFTGLPVDAMVALRRDLRDNSLTYRVIKKSVLKRVLEKLGIEREAEWFDGGCGVCMGNDIVLGCRVLSGFEGLKLKGGWFSGEVIPSLKVKEIAKIPGRDVLLGNLLADLNFSISGFVWVLQGILSKIVWVLDEVRRKKGDKDG